MASIKDRAAALKLAEKLSVRPTSGQALKPVHKCLQWRSLITHLKSTVTIKRRRVHMKSHSDCFLGSEAVDVVAEHLKLSLNFEEGHVTRPKVVCVCQALLDCNVFEVVGTKPTGKDTKQVFQDCKNSLYRFVGVHIPSIDELERGVLAVGLEMFFCSNPSEKHKEHTLGSSSHLEMLDVPDMDSLSLEASVDSPSQSQSGARYPQSLVDEVWQELTLLRLLNLVELPVLDGILHCSPKPVSSPLQLPHSDLDLIHSSSHLDRKVLSAFRDSQEDEWLCAALDCMDFVSDKSVMDLSKALPRCFSEDPNGIQRSCYEQPLLSSSSLSNYKLLVYEALAKHYSHTDRAPLMPQHMTDIYNAIIELLVTAKLGTALEALQLCLKLLPISNREELRRLLTFMALAAEPQAIKLEAEMENRLAVRRSFSRAILHSKSLTKEKEDLMVVFMLSNIQEIFKIPGALHKDVSNKLAHLVQGQHPDVTGTGSGFCHQVSKRTYVDSTKKTTNDELWKLLNNIHCDIKISSKERKRLLGQFYQAHPEVFNQYFEPKMPKDSDESREGREGSKETTEEMVKKKVRVQTPSPHRGNTSQASPPRIVSVEELMETAKGVTNMALAHEIVVNQVFQVTPIELPEDSLERRVKEIMHKAFWDCLDTQLKENPPSYDHAIKLLSEIKEILLSFLLPGHGRLRSRIEEVLDLPLIQQQAEKGALDIGQLSQFIVGMMGALCAPCRDDDINKLKEITDIVALLKSIFTVLDLMKVDMANFALSSIRPHLMQQSVEYERTKFQEFLEKQPSRCLRLHREMVNGHHKCNRESDECCTSSESPSLLPLHVHNQAYLRLLRWDHTTEPFPETVLMDQMRFLEMQQEAERLVMIASILLIIYTTTGEAISGLPGLMDKLKNTVNVMLVDMHSPNFSAQEALASIGEKVCVELNDCLSQHGYSPFSTEKKSTLKGQIIATILPDNAVRKLIESRVQSYFLASLEYTLHQTQPALPGGLAPLSRELKELAVRFSRLVNFNKLVFSPFYQKILQKILMPAVLFEGMASKVLIYPSHLHATQTSALGTSSSGTGRQPSETHRGNNTSSSRAFQHRPPPKTYVIGVNYGIAYPNNVIPSGAESGGQQETTDREAWALNTAELEAQNRSQEVEEVGSPRASRESVGLDCGLLKGACVPTRDVSRSQVRWRTTRGQELCWRHADSRGGICCASGRCDHVTKQLGNNADTVRGGVRDCHSLSTTEGMALERQRMNRD
ncbi:hypothetical protein WMY93_023944 [Mugilogobius chulae]|uniref:DEP domain-containing protein n=1 Tax=Mugilogobius chulae TaxID=88201 RepID=A0AAW0N766_9GOBI